MRSQTSSRASSTVHPGSRHVPGLHYTHEGNNLSQEEGGSGGSTSETERVADGVGSAGEQRRGSRARGGSRAAVTVSKHSYILIVGCKSLPSAAGGDSGLAGRSGDHGNRGGTASGRTGRTGHDTTDLDSAGARRSTRNHDGRVGGGRDAGGDGDDRGAAGGHLNGDHGGSRGLRSRGLAGGSLNRGRSNGSAGGHGGRGSHGDGRGLSLNALGSAGGGLTAGAVGDRGTTRGDGHILSRVDGVNITLGDGDGAEAESNGGSSETHVD